MSQAKKYNICIKYFWAMRKMQYLQNFTIRIYTSKSIGLKGIFTASIVLLQNCFGPGEKMLYLHYVLLGQAKKYNICTKYFWARRKKCNICQIPQSEFTHQNLLDLRAFFTAAIVLLQNCFGPDKGAHRCTPFNVRFVCGP